MRLHTDALTMQDIEFAAVTAGVTLLGASQHGSQRRSHAFEVALSGSGRHGGQWGHGSAKSATWDEWGVFLADLFGKDDALTIPRVYESHEFFAWATGGRYEPWIGPQHVQHRWGLGVPNCTRSYSVQQCECGAIRRWMLQGHTFAELIAA